MSDKEDLEEVERIIYSGGVCCLAAFCDWAHGTRWRITSKYIEQTRGRCCKDIEHIQLVRVTDIEYSGGCGLCCCYGTITIHSSDKTNPIMVISGLRGAESVYKLLRDEVNQLTSGKNVRLEMT